jgi:thiol-disulfide isomerase/thioredoxin
MLTVTSRQALNAEFLRSKFDGGLDYESYLATDPIKAGPWRDFARHVALSSAQQSLLKEFARDINVVCVSGIWCGDCVQQVPMLDVIQQANPAKIHVRYLDRDEHKDLGDQVKICGGNRVPTVLFLAEDFEFVSLLGDRTLARYRAIAAKQLGASCPLPGASVPQGEVDATLQDWVNEFERVHLLLRTSGRLRQKHGD